eukprot:g1798.t1
MKVAVVSVALILVCAASSTSTLESFGRWAAHHHKSYASDAERSRRQVIWQEQARSIVEHNNKNLSWIAGPNEWMDLTWEEWQARFIMPQAKQNCSATTGNYKRRAATLPAAVDWRDKMPKEWHVKMQGHCGSCWTFSTVGSLEAHTYLATGSFVNISEQQLVDCAGGFNNFGCNGGLPSQAFEYIHYNGGIDTEETYPYTAVTGKECKYDGKPAATVAHVVNITYLDEDELLDAVGSVGPVSIAYQVAPDFRNYHAGVYDGQCNQTVTDVNHAVVAVGYGEESGKAYWNV